MTLDQIEKQARELQKFAITSDSKWAAEVLLAVMPVVAAAATCAQHDADAERVTHGHMLHDYLEKSARVHLALRDAVAAMHLALGKDLFDADSHALAPRRR